MEEQNGRNAELKRSRDRVAEIVLVEDNAIDAQLTLRALQRCGLDHRVEHVTDGAEALEYIKSMSLFGTGTQPMPRLILLDLGLHKLGGLQVLRQLKSDEHTQSIPIVVLTSSTMAIEVMESYKLGVNSYVIKPNEPKKFAEIVAGIGNYWLSINEPPPA